MDDFSALLGTFIAESEEFLRSMETILLAMETSSSTSDKEKQVQHLFRAAHSIKGSASMFGLTELSTAAHTLEDCFGILRDRADLNQLDGELINDLLSGVDILKGLLEKTRTQAAIAPEDYQDLLPLKQTLETRYQAQETSEAEDEEEPVNSSLIRGIFEMELPPLLERFETLITQVNPDNLSQTQSQLEELYQQLSGMAQLLNLPDIAAIIDPLPKWLTRPEMAIEELQRQGYPLIAALEQARQRRLGRADPDPESQRPEAAESEPSPDFSASSQRPTIRVDVQSLTELVNWVGELVIHRTHLEVQQAQLRSEAKRIRRSVLELNLFGRDLRDEYDRLTVEPHQTVSDGQNRGFDPLELDRYSDFHSTAQSVIETTQAIAQSSGRIDDLSLQLDRNTEQIRRITDRLRSRVYNLRVVPFSRCVDHLPRALRELCRQHHKEVNLVLLGRDTKLDESLVDALRDPLIQLVRNAFDHGIESPEERREAGKPPSGEIEIAASHQGGQTLITLTDDGRGIDANAIRHQAIAQGIIDAEQAETLSLNDIYDFLLLPGFTTRTQTNQLSGRGVGLDVVTTNLRQVRGTLKVDSQPGKGSRFMIKLPLMLSITNALLVRVDHQTLAIPLDAVEEILQIEASHLQMVGDQTMLPWRDEFIRLTRLQDLLHYKYPSDDEPSPDPLNQDTIPVLVLASAEGVLAIAVERLLGQQEIVVKPIPPPLVKPPGLMGSTILGDGRVVLIVDADDLITQVQPTETVTMTPRDGERHVHPLSGESVSQILVVDDAYTIRQLLSLLLQGAHYRVELAKDGQEAFDKLLGGLSCDLVIADIEMPKMDGFELLEAIKAQPELCQIPVAMLTSRSGSKHRQRALELGAADYFTKPYNEAALLAAIANILSPSPNPQ
ncbi:MAG: hybrid sensor histidine kinase/response regulator [Sodalinema sp.]|uniref:hybrid sensor histidine kinase/response regulator n=1 Tax=Sodalinema sp. TaxID=3080550 RepID=UPI001206C2C8|nr:MAG: hybrid sensor histidine kinase/response regulator [Phormidium sp. SL48-SHIP]